MASNWKHNRKMQLIAKIKKKNILFNGEKRKLKKRDKRGKQRSFLLSFALASLKFKLNMKKINENVIDKTITNLAKFD